MKTHRVTSRREILLITGSLLCLARSEEILGAGATDGRESTNSLAGPQPSSALIGRMHQVTMLEFHTDRPLLEVRVLANSKVVHSLFIPEGYQRSLKLAAAVSMRQHSASIYLAVGNHIGEFTAEYGPFQDPRDTSPTEDYWPGKYAILSVDVENEV